MESVQKEELEVRTKGATDRLFRSSWIDRLVDWIANLPGPSWLAFIVLFILLGLLSHLGFWATGHQTPGSFTIDIFLNQFWIITVLFAYQYLDQDAERALGDFRPLMKLSDEDFSKSLQLFTNLPARPVALLTVIGIPIALYLDPGFSRAEALGGNSSLSPFLIIGPISISLALIYTYRIVRQLRLISRFYAQVSAIDLYDLGPVYSLSAHTAKAGLALLLAVYLNILPAPEVLEFASLTAVVGLLSLLALAAFFLPLRGINRRLVQVKRNLLQSTQLRIKEAFTKIEKSYDASEFGEISALNSVVLALQNQRNYINMIPTWPWEASTLRGFISLVLLPIIIWIVQQILGRLFG